LTQYKASAGSARVARANDRAAARQDLDSASLTPDCQWPCASARRGAEGFWTDIVCELCMDRLFGGAVRVLLQTVGRQRGNDGGC
jgi:hypothetical protein